MSWLTEEMKETLARLSSQSIQRQRYKFDDHRHPVISRSFDFDGEMITRADGTAEFIREPYQNHSIQLPKLSDMDFNKGELCNASDGIRYGIDFGYHDSSEVLVYGGEAYGKTQSMLKWIQMSGRAQRTLSDFSHLNINKMKIEALNKANELAGDIKDLQAHKKNVEEAAQQELKEPRFKITLYSNSSVHLRSNLVTAAFIKQYIANIDKAIRDLERQIEKL